MKIVRGFLAVAAFWTFVWVLLVHPEWVLVSLLGIFVLGVSCMIFVEAAGI